VSSITAISEAARAIGKGATPEIEASPIVELDQVRKEIETVVTGRKRDEAQLDYQLQLVRKITEAVGESIFITHANGRVTFANTEAIETFGFSAEELLGQTLHEKVHYRYPDGRPMPRSECVFARTRCAGKMIKNHEDVFFRKDGRAVIVECSHARLEADGRPIGAVLIVRDITERKRLLAEMEKRAAQPAEAD